MPDGYHVGPGVLEDIASTLRQAAEHLDSAGGSAPSAPDAGQASPAVAAILAKLVDNAGQLVVATGTAGDAVAKGDRAYLDQEDDARSSIAETGPN